LDFANKQLHIILIPWSSLNVHSKYVHFWHSWFPLPPRQAYTSHQSFPPKNVRVATLRLQAMLRIFKFWVTPISLNWQFYENHKRQCSVEDTCTTIKLCWRLRSHQCSNFNCFSWNWSSTQQAFHFVLKFARMKIIRIIREYSVAIEFYSVKLTRFYSKRNFEKNSSHFNFDFSFLANI
jgi:hypothetical protein